MNSDIQRAINAEKTFYSKNHLLITFHDQEFTENTIYQLHKNVKSVHILQPDFIPKKRYIIEVKDLSEVDSVKEAIMRSCSDKLTITIMDNFTENYKQIDPYKILVRNLPNTITDREIKQLYPLCTECSFINGDSKYTKSMLVHFSNVEDSILAFKTTNHILYHSNNLIVQFYRDRNKIKNNDVVNFEDNSDSDDDISKWEKIENDCLKNKKVSDTLIILNFPMNTTGEDIMKLYPNCKQYKFIINSSSKSKTALIRFRRIEDAIKMYTASNNIFKNHLLHIDFHYKSFDAVTFSKSFKLGELEQDKKNAEKHKRVNNIENEQNHFKNEERRKNSLTGKFVEQNIKLKEETQNEAINSCVLQVENLPSSTTTQDLQELFPKYQQCEIKIEKANDCSSAYLSFKNSHDAMQAFNSTENRIYKRRMLSVKYKSKKIKINPFALLKRKPAKIINSNCDKRNNTKNNLNQNFENDDVVLVEEMSSNQMKIISEDDIDYKSEDEDYTDDVFAGIDLDTEEMDNEDNISEDNDFNGVELDDDTVLPLDEDDF